MKEKAESYEGTPSKTLVQYKADLTTFSLRDFERSSLTEIFKQIEKANIVYLGDFHTFDQSTRNLERIIRALTRNKETIILGVEFIDFKNQDKVDDFLRHHLTELEFLEEIEYKESWRFPWSHYKDLFELAAKNGFQILALNSKGSLIERDSFAANLIAQSLKKNPTAKFLTLFGELHIACDKLPSKVSHYYKKDLKQLIIHQNLDEVFWKTQEESIQKEEEPPQIIKFNEFEFSIQTSPPWIKYESQIYWYEHLMEDPDFDIHEYIMETGFKVFHGDTQENFLIIIKEVLKILNLNTFSSEELEDFNLLDHTGLNLVVNKIDQYNKGELRSYLKTMLIEGNPFKLPYQNFYYCSSYSVNRLSFLAGIKIQNLFLHKKSKSEKTALEAGSIDIFLFFLQQSIIAYFSSKIINPFRKCNLFYDLKVNFKDPKTPPAEKESLDLIFKILEKDLLNESFFTEVEISQIYSVAKSIGYIMSDSYFENFFKKDVVSSREILTIILNLDDSIKSYFELKKILLDEQDFKNQKKRFF